MAQFAAKRLKRSDLTLFDVQFRKQNAGNQKAINLNRNVFVDLLFPAAPAMAGGPSKFPCELRIYGPGGINNPRIVTRKVIAAAGTQKNWRLNGETIYADPQSPLPDRYDNLAENDFAIFAFEGSGVPSEISLLLVSATDQADAPLFDRVEQVVGTKRMIALTSEQMADLASRCPSDHAIHDLWVPRVDEVAELVAFGSSKGLLEVRSRGISRNSHAALAQARANFEKVGRDGEGLINEYLSEQVEQGTCSHFTWEAELNATHPFDFTAQFGSEEVLIEVKSTTGDAKRAMMISQAEIEFAAANPQVELWRVSQLEESRAVLHRSKGFHDLARKILSLEFTPNVQPNSWTVAFDALEPWSEPLHVLVANEED